MRLAGQGGQCAEAALPSDLLAQRDKHPAVVHPASM